MSPSFDSLISHFDDYDSYLKRLNKDSRHRETVRSLLKNDGIIDTAVPTRELAQLSLGVGNGYRDLYGIHGVPCIRKKQEGTSAILDFDMLERQAAHTVLVDSDPIYDHHFQALNREEGGRVLALNIEADQAIKTLKDKQQESDLALRNFVVGLRIDHHMIPDADKFLRLIGTVIDSNADLIFTIGAGNNLEEFEGRLNCFDKLCATLTRIGLKPVRLLLHGKGSPQEQRSRPNFGQLAYTSYQILYCKLQRDLFVNLGSCEERGPGKPIRDE